MTLAELLDKFRKYKAQLLTQFNQRLFYLDTALLAVIALGMAKPLFCYMILLNWLPRLFVVCGLWRSPGIKLYIFDATHFALGHSALLALALLGVFSAVAVFMAASVAVTMPTAAGMLILRVIRALPDLAVSCYVLSFFIINPIVHLAYNVGLVINYGWNRWLVYWHRPTLAPLPGVSQVPKDALNDKAMLLLHNHAVTQLYQTPESFRAYLSLHPAVSPSQIEAYITRAQPFFVKPIAKPDIRQEAPLLWLSADLMSCVAMHLLSTNYQSLRLVSKRVRELTNLAIPKLEITKAQHFFPRFSHVLKEMREKGYVIDGQAFARAIFNYAKIYGGKAIRAGKLSDEFLLPSATAAVLQGDLAALERISYDAYDPNARIPWWYGPIRHTIRLGDAAGFRFLAKFGSEYTALPLPRGDIHHCLGPDTLTPKEKEIYWQCCPDQVINHVSCLRSIQQDPEFLRIFFFSSYLSLEYIHNILRTDNRDLLQYLLEEFPDAVYRNVIDTYRLNDIVFVGAQVGQRLVIYAEGIVKHDVEALVSALQGTLPEDKAQIREFIEAVNDDKLALNIFNTIMCWIRESNTQQLLGLIRLLDVDDIFIDITAGEAAAEAYVSAYLRFKYIFLEVAAFLPAMFASNSQDCWRYLLDYCDLPELCQQYCAHKPAKNLLEAIMKSGNPVICRWFLNETPFTYQVEELITAALTYANPEIYRLVCGTQMLTATQLQTATEAGNIALVQEYSQSTKLDLDPNVYGELLTRACALADPQIEIIYCWLQCLYKLQPDQQVRERVIAGLNIEKEYVKELVDALRFVNPEFRSVESLQRIGI